MKRQNLSGIGIDLVEVSRVRSLALRSPGFLGRVFTPAELAYCGRSRNKYERLAARFAVKEAVIKALDDRELALSAIEVSNSATGRPSVKVRGRSGLRFLVSISHTAGCACAAVAAFS